MREELIVRVDGKLNMSLLLTTMLKLCAETAGEEVEAMSLERKTDLEDKRLFVRVD